MATGGRGAGGTGDVDQVTRLSTAVASAVVQALGQQSQVAGQASDGRVRPSVSSTNTDCNVVSITRSNINTQR